MQPYRKKSVRCITVERNEGDDNSESSEMESSSDSEQAKSQIGTRRNAPRDGQKLAGGVATKRLLWALV
jgi:hypothetical protein